MGCGIDGEQVMTWGSNASFTKFPCPYCGTEQVDDTDTGPTVTSPCVRKPCGGGGSSHGSAGEL